MKTLRNKRLERCHRSPCPQPLDGTAIDQLAKDGVDVVADPTQSRAPARVGISLGGPLGSQQIDAVLLPLGGDLGCPVIAVPD